MKKLFVICALVIFSHYTSIAQTVIKQETKTVWRTKPKTAPETTVALPETTAGHYGKTELTATRSKKHHGKHKHKKN